METLGTYLREEREKQGKTLEYIAEKTCISKATLQAIEDDQNERMPPASYLRGFLKLYARELDLRAEDLLERLPHQRPKRSSLALPDAPDIESSKKPWLKIFIAVGIACIAGLWAWQIFFGLAPVSQEAPVQIISPRPAVPDALLEHPDTAENPPHIDQTSTPEPVSEPKMIPEIPTVSEQKTALEIPTEESPPVAPERFMVTFIARGIVWMNMQADDGTIVDITLRDGEQYRASAARTLTVRLGNPALVDIEYNGQHVPLPGKPGIPLDLVFPDCLQQ